MPERGNKAQIKTVVDKLFEEASKKIITSEDKVVLDSLRVLLRTVEDDLLDPKP
jgi:hypothetical protein